MSNLSKRHRKLSWAKREGAITAMSISFRNRLDNQILTVFSSGFSTGPTGPEDVETAKT